MGETSRFPRSGRDGPPFAPLPALPIPPRLTACMRWPRCRVVALHLENGLMPRASRTSLMTMPWRAAAAPALAAVAAFAWAAWWRPDVDTTLFNADVLYELHRVQRCLADFPNVTSIDTYSRAGLDLHLHWLGPFTLLLACIAKLLGAANASVRELASTLALVPPMLGAITAATMVLLARRLGATPFAATVAGLGMAFSGDALSVFHHGRIDHHVFIPLGLTIAALGWASRSLPTWAVGHALLFLMAPQATGVSTLLLLVAGGSECVGRAWRAGKPFDRAPSFLFMPAAVALFALIVARAIDPAAPALFSADALAFSGLNVAWVALVGGLLALATRLIERPMTPTRRMELLAGMTLALGSLLGLVLVMSDRAGSALDRDRKSVV